MALPKAELHVHLEGTADEETVRALRVRRRAPVPANLAALYRHRDFREFLEHFRALLDLLSAPEDYGFLAGRYLDFSATQGVLHVEFYLSLASALRRGLPVRAVLESIQSAVQERRGRITANVILDCVRQFGPQDAMHALRSVLPHRDLGLVVGFGIGGDESSVPAAEFSRVYACARDAGFKTTVHAGEVGGHEEVDAVLDALKPDRIAHGIAAAKSPRLLDRLRREKVTLDVCLTSNLQTGAVNRIEEHPLPVLLDAGVPVTLGSDDPALFGTDLLGEFELAANSLGIGGATLARIARQSLDSRFSQP